MRKNKLFLVCIILIFFIFSLNNVCAENIFENKNHMVLLATTQSGEIEKGGVADLYLKVTKGSGTVYMDAYSLTKLDTQISIRFAKEIACNYLEIDCNNYDFFYTIQSDSIIIGGPSAGAALTTLTIATLKDLKIDKKTAVTGTINSGGFIGNVGGIQEKIYAGYSAGINKIIIPKGSLKRSINSNNSHGDEKKNISNFILENDITIVEVTSIDEVIKEFTGKEFTGNKAKKEINVSKKYLEIMENVRNKLCNRTNNLLDNVTLINDTLYLDAKDLINKSEFFVKENAYYSSASFCFGANIKLNNLVLKQSNLTKDQLFEIAINLEENVSFYNDYINEKKIDTLSKLQTFIIVNERIIESDEYLEIVFDLISEYDNLDGNRTNTTKIKQEKLIEKIKENLAYSKERFMSAVFWSEFFILPGKKFDINNEVLKNSCTQKLHEAQERIQYTSIYFPANFINLNEQLNSAYLDREKKNYELCLFRASKVKAQANLILDSLSITENVIINYLDIKFDHIKDVIIKQQENKNFPILGYSYYEYAKSLSVNDPSSALLYSEYALELSNLELYFKEQTFSFKNHNLPINKTLIYFFLIGFFIGIIFIALFLIPNYINNKEKNNHIKIKIKHK
ncbi:MAG: S16 family serine protease [Candidatus Woesearchaeota archaeon]